MKFYKPENLDNLFDLLALNSDRKYFLAGGTDINVQIKNGIIKDGEIIYINHLNELSGIRRLLFQIFILATKST
jgi:CO/xanthine dehydrogenase FAD-binding subunit